MLLEQPVNGGCPMHAPLDIFKKDVRGNLIWLDCVVDLDAARSRINQLALTPGEYFVFDQRTQQIAASVVQSNSTDF
jgi:hypothetical protein